MTEKETRTMIDKIIDSVRKLLKMEPLCRHNFERFYYDSYPSGYTEYEQCTKCKVGATRTMFNCSGDCGWHKMEKEDVRRFKIRLAHESRRNQIICANCSSENVDVWTDDAFIYDEFHNTLCEDCGCHLSRRRKAKCRFAHELTMPSFNPNPVTR